MFMQYMIAFLFTFTLSKINAQRSQEAQSKDIKAEVYSYTNDNKGDGQYQFKFETSNDIRRSENGRFDEDGNYIVEGFYSFVADDGKTYYVTYVADKSGYHPTVINDAGVPIIPEYQIPEPPVTAVQFGLSQQVVATLLG